MTVIDSCKLMEIYAVCPKCGCEFIDMANGPGFVGFEVEPVYYELQEQDFAEFTAQTRIF